MRDTGDEYSTTIHTPDVMDSETSTTRSSSKRTLIIVMEISVDSEQFHQ